MSCTLSLSKQLQCPNFDLFEDQITTVSALTALKNRQNETVLQIFFNNLKIRLINLILKFEYHGWQ
jgi:hypothetical protein